MNPNPAVGVLYHWLGGLASGSFYVPYRGVKGWAWETFWLAGGFFSWIIAPWVLAGLLTKDLFAVLQEAPASSLLWAVFFGLLWGVGGLTFGLTMRYLGLSLGMAMVLGLCAAFRHADAADFQRHIHDPGGGNGFGPRDPAGNSGLSLRHRRGRFRWHRQRTQYVLGRKAESDQGI